MATQTPVRTALDEFQARCKTLRFLLKTLIGSGGLKSEAPLALLIEAVTQDVEPLDREITAVRDRERELRHAGSLLANFAFNLEQRPTLDAHAVGFLRECRLAWDRTIAAHAGRPAAAPPADSERLLDALDRMATGLVTPPAVPTIDGVLFQLEDAMHFCCDAPLSCDAMSLTRIWRSILTHYSEALRGVSPEPSEEPNRNASATILETRKATAEGPSPSEDV
jgi:hypothetical protein